MTFIIVSILLIAFYFDRAIKIAGISRQQRRVNLDFVVLLRTQNAIAKLFGNMLNVDFDKADNDRVHSKEIARIEIRGLEYMHSVVRTIQMGKFPKYSSCHNMINFDIRN